MPPKLRVRTGSFPRKAQESVDSLAPLLAAIPICGRDDQLGLGHSMRRRGKRQREASNTCAVSRNRVDSVHTRDTKCAVAVEACDL
jgi:hypothetical protein